MLPKNHALILAILALVVVGYGLATIPRPFDAIVEAQAQQHLITDTVNANGDAATITINTRGVTTATVDITGTFVETLTFNVVGTDADPVACTPVGGGAAVTSATAVGKFVCPVLGWASFNVTGSGFSSGAATVRIQLAGNQN